MTQSTRSFDGSGFVRPKCRRSGLTLIELLVVLLIISVLLCLLLPAVQSARTKMQATACQNNVRQISLALRHCIYTTKRFPEPNRWTVDILKWMEEWPLAEEMAGNFDPNGNYPRPRLFRCPMQPDFDSRVEHVGVCHYVLAVDRPVPRGKADRVRFEIHDRELLSEDEPQVPWYIAPELSFVGQGKLLATKPGPHPPGLYMTATGSYPR
jgi:prepilin-type N-terminal cleavage/methylation domain-containing protein